MLYRPEPEIVKVIEHIPSVTFKQLAHQAAHMSPSGKAGLAGQVVRQELKATKPTRLIAMAATGASASNLARALIRRPNKTTVDLIDDDTEGRICRFGCSRACNHKIEIEMSNGSMSALPSKADVPQHRLDVRFVPKADIRPFPSIVVGRELHRGQVVFFLIEFE